MTAPAPATPAAGVSPLRRMRPRGAPRLPLWAVALIALAVGLVGVVIGRSVGPTPPPDAADVVDREIVPLVVDADGLWAAGTGPLPAVGEQLAQLRRTGQAEIGEHAEGWTEAYDALLRRMVGVEVPAVARPVQRQFVNAVMLSRDALELLVAADAVDDPDVRRELSSEALRLRTRSEQLTQTARASLVDLRGGTTGVAEPSPLPSLDELR